MPSALAVGPNGICLDIVSLSSDISLFLIPLWETARYRPNLSFIAYSAPPSPTPPQPNTIKANNKSLMLPPLCENGTNLRTQLKLHYLSSAELSIDQYMSSRMPFFNDVSITTIAKDKSKLKLFADPDSRHLGQSESYYNKMAPRVPVLPKPRTYRSERFNPRK